MLTKVHLWVTHPVWVDNLKNMTIVFDNNIVCYKQDLGVEFSGLKVESVDTRNLVNPYRCLSQVPVQILHSFCNSWEFGVHHKKASNGAEMRLLEWVTVIHGLEESRWWQFNKLELITQHLLQHWAGSDLYSSWKTNSDLQKDVDQFGHKLHQNRNCTWTSSLCIEGLSPQ